tara:strand:- start:1255 stop:1689 length:435 start_codon:yes stop_codon:yes gene_type:complete
MNFYLILKSLHLIAVISWMAGLLYLPRIFVYHAENNSNNSISSVFKIMERRLYFYIMYPAMLLSWIFGLSIIHFQGAELIQAKWFIFKILAVLILTGYHFYLGYFLRVFSQDVNNKTPKYFRIINEIPTILLIIIVFLAILKPI